MNISVVLPELILFCGSLFILMIDVFFAKRNKEFFYITHLLTLLICALAIVGTFKNFAQSELYFNQFYQNSPIIALSKCFLILLVTFVVVISLRFVAMMEKFSAEFLALMLIACTGGLIMISSNDFLAFYLGIELQALSFYLLSAIKTDSKKSSEAGIKYFILGCLASGILLYGISMIYGYMGTTNFTVIADLVEKQKNDVPVGFLLGIVLVMIAMFFKLGNAPFHMWYPDIIEGSATVVATLFATVGKFTSVIALTFLIYKFSWSILSHIMIFVGLISIIVGSLGAIFQKNLKRLLAFSSVAHVGFIILGLAGLGKNVITAVLFYIFIYSIISLGIFGFLNLLISGNQIDNDETDKKTFAISSLAGLSKSNPTIALCLSLLIFSTAGIPPLAGFFSKFYIISAVITTGYFKFALIAILLTVISAFYYLRIIKIIYFDTPSSQIIIDDSIAIKSIIIAATILNTIIIIFIDQILSMFNGFIS
ncbi:NADH-quinone oxidoreductase subunit N [Alphaproteobacteria bacterium]|nr:NADH-quinone oxidoreductase subunit N [Alphaproteobacteria bacterium]